MKNKIKLIITILSVTTIFLLIALTSNYSIEVNASSSPKIEFSIKVDNQDNMSKEDFNSYADKTPASARAIVFDVYATALSEDVSLGMFAGYFITNYNYFSETQTTFISGTKYNEDEEDDIPLFEMLYGSYHQDKNERGYFLNLRRTEYYKDVFGTDRVMLNKNEETHVFSLSIRRNTELTEENISFGFEFFYDWSESGAIVNGDTKSESEYIYFDPPKGINLVTTKKFNVGEMEAELNAKLTGASIQGQNKTYDVTEFDVTEFDEYIASIEVTYKDSLNSLEVTPLYEKSSGVSSTIKFFNSSNEEKLPDDDFITGDYIKIVTIDDSDNTVTETYIINIDVTEASSDNNIQFKYLIAGLPAGEKPIVPVVGTEYKLEVDFNTTEATIYGIPSNDLANIISPTPVGREANIKKTLTVGENEFGPFIVKAEDGIDKKHYVIVIRKEGSKNTEVTVNYEWNDGLGHSDTLDLKPDNQIIELELDSKTSYLGFNLNFGHENQKIEYKIGDGVYKNYLKGITNPINIFNKSGSFGTTHRLFIKVTAEDEETETIYQVNIKIKETNDTSLNNDSVAIKEQERNAYKLTNLSNLEYVLIDPIGEIGSEYIDIIIKPHSFQEVKFGDGSYEPNEHSLRLYESDLPNRTNEFHFTVRAQDKKEEQTYTIKIIRKSNQAEIKEMVFRETGSSNIYAEFSKGDFIQDPHDEYIYTYKFSHGKIANLNQLQLNITSSDGSKISTSSNNYQSVSLDFTSQSNYDSKVIQTIFNVVSENGLVTKTYTINIEKEAASTDVDLDWIQIDGIQYSDYNNSLVNPTFDKYIITPQDATTQSKNVYIQVQLADGSLAKVSINNQNGTGRNLQLERPHLTTLVIKVTAEDERVTNTITIPLYFGTDDSTLNNITIAGTEYVFDKDEYDVSIDIPYSFPNTALVVGTLNSGNSQVIIDGLVRSSANLAIGNTTIILVQAKSEIGTLGEIYKITLNRQDAQTENVLKDLVVFRGDNTEVLINFTPGVKTYSVRVDDIGSLWPVRIEASVEESHRSYINAVGQKRFSVSRNLNSGQEGQVVITVYSEGGIANEYIINLYRANDILEFESVTISGSGFTTTTYLYSDFTSNTLVLPNINYSTSELNIEFKMIGSSNSNINSNINFIGNSLFGVWKLNNTGTTAPNSGVFTVLSQAGNLSSPFTITVVRENPLKIAELDNLEVLVGGINIFDTLKPVGGYGNMYSLRVDRNINEVFINASVVIGDRSSIRDFGEPSLNETHRIYNKGFSLNEGTYRDIIIDVLAEDGVTYKTHTIRVYRQNSNIDINNIILDIDNIVIYSGNSFTDAINALKNREIVFTDKKLNITLQPEDVHSKIYFNGGARTTPTGNGLVIGSFDLIAGDGTITLRVESDIANNLVTDEFKTESYTFTYTKTPASKVAELETLELIVGGINIMEDIFIPSTRTYGNSPNFIRVDRINDEIEIKATAKDFGSVSGLEIRGLNEGKDQVNIRVTSQDGSLTVTYTVHLYRYDDENGIDDILIDGLVRDFILNTETNNYEFDLGNLAYTKSQISLLPQLSNNFAVYFVNGTLATSNLVNLEYGENIIEFYVVSEFEHKVKNNSIKGDKYIIKYNRIAPFEDSEINFDLSDDLGIVLSSNNGMYTYTYTLADTSLLEELTLNIILKDSRQSLSGDFIEGNNLITLDIREDKSIDQTIKFTVLSENNKSQEYEIRITKGVPMSDNFDIDDITITNNLNETYSYTIEDELGIKVISLGKVLYEVNKLTLNILKADEKASLNIANPYVRDLEVGKNTIIFTITSEDGNGSQTYHILIERGDANDDVNLKEIKIIDVNNPGTNLVGLLNISSRGVTFVPGDHKNEIIYLDESYIGKALNLEFIKEFKNQTVTISNSSITLKVGTDNTFIINVVAENGDSREYKFTFHVLYETNDLVSLLLNTDNIDFKNVSRYETKLENVVVLPTLEEKFGGYKVFIDGIEITGSTKQFALNIGDVRTLGILVYTQSDNLNPVTSYEIEVERVPLSTNNKLDEIRFLDPLNSGVFLFGLESRNPTQGIFDSNTYTYTVELGLEYLNKVISLVTVNGDEFQTVILNPTSKTLVRGENVFNITVQAENKNPEEVVVISYTIKIMVKNKENDLTKLTINGETLNLNETPIEFTTENETANIVPTMANNDGSFVLKDGNGNVITNPYNLSLGDNKIVIEVLNEYGDVVQEYEVNITRNIVSDTSFNDLKLIGSDNTNYLVGFDKDTREYDIEIPQNVNFVTLSANIHSKATAIGLGRHDINLNETITITFQVTAENGDTSLDYTFNVTRRALSKNNMLKEIYITDPMDPTSFILGLNTKTTKVEFKPDVRNYQIDLSIDYLNILYRDLTIRYTKGDDYQTISGNTSYPIPIRLKKGNDNEVIITVLAEDVNNTDPFIYTLVFNVLNDKNSLKSLSINNDNVSFNEELNLYETESKTANIIAELANNDGSYILKDNLNNIITSPYSLECGDNIIKVEVLNEFSNVVETHNINIFRMPSSDISFTDISLIGSDNNNYLPFFVDSKYIYDIELPNEVTNITLNATAYELATIHGKATYPINEGETITIKFYIKAENGDVSETYTFNVTRRALSINNKLEEIHISSAIGDNKNLLGLIDKNPVQSFNKDIKKYNFNLGLEYLNALLIVSYVEGDIYQKIDNQNPQTIKLEHGVNTITITVIPEDTTNSTPNIYTITINVLNKENSLEALTINDDEITLNTFDLEYTTEEEQANLALSLEDSNGSVVIKDSLGNEVNPLVYLELGLNKFTIEILNEYNEVSETYNLNITRNKSTDHSFSNLTITGSDLINYLTNFDLEIYEYNIEVPQNVEFVTLNANIHSKATAIGLGRHDINLNETITITFQVTAENGDTSLDYTFNVTRRALSTNNKLNEIRIVDPMDPTSYLLGLDAKNPLVIFDPNTRNYTINLGLEYLNILYRDLTLRYEKGDNYQVVDRNSPIPIRLTRDKNEVVITVIAEDSNNTTPFIYTITINVLNSTNSLEELNINNELVTIPSDNIILFETESEQANITYKPENNDGKVIIKDENGKILTNLIDLDMGKNIVIIEVENEFGDVVNEYEIIITRNADSDTSLHAELIGNDDIDYLSFDDKTLVYYVTVPFEVSEVSLNITNNPKAISTGEQTVSLASGIETYLEFFVTAENGDVSDTYKIYVTREFNTEDKLSSLTIETDKEELLSSINFNKENNYYYFQVNEQHTYVIFMHQANYGQTVTGVLFDEQISLNHGLNTYEIIVQPHDLTLSPFVITIEIEVINSNTDLDKLLVDNKNILEPDKNIYTLEDVSSDTKQINIEGILSDLNGTIAINGQLTSTLEVDLVPGENIIVIEITSEDLSTTKEYIIKVTQLLEDIDVLEELSIETNNNDYLLGLDDKNPEVPFNAETFTYSITVNETVEFIKMNYVLGSQKQTIIGDFDVELNINHGLNTYIVEVYPEDPTLEGNIYKIEITKVYENIDLETLLVDGEDIYIENTTSYELDNLTTDTKSIIVIPTLTNEYGKYEIKDNNGNIITNNEVPVYFGNNKITITLTSEDGSVTKEYTINFEQVLSSNNEVIDLEVIDLANNVNKIIFDNNTLTYDVKFNYSSENARIRITTNDKAKVYINELYKANAREDFTLIPGESRFIAVYIEAEDGTKGEIYKVNIYRMTEDEGRMSDNNKLRDLKLEIPLDEIPFNFEQNKLEYTIRVPYTAEEIYLKGYPEHHGATVHNEGAYRLEVGSNDPIYIRVQAEDGTPSRIQYKVTFVREEPNTDTSLKDLVVKDLNGNVLEFDNNVKFDSDNRIYTITLDKESYINQVRIDTVLNNQTQSIFGNGVVSLHGEIEGQYNTVLPVTVVAEDGSSEDYIIYILHDLDFSNITEIKDISIIGDDRISYFGLEFEGDIYNYDVYVPFNVLETRLIVQTLGNVIYLDNNDKEIDDNRLQQFNSDNLIVYRFKVQSMNEQNESPVYEINVIREVADSNALLETILIDGKEILDFDPLVNNYEYIQFILDPNKVDILAKPQSETSIVNGNKTYTLIEGESTFISIVVTAQDKTTNTYIVEVKYVNSNALLGELSVYELDEFGNEFQIPIELKPGEFNYTVQIDKNINLINIKGSGEDQGGARLRGFGQYRIGETDLVIPITVTSGDGKEERTYLVTITKSMRGDASLETVLINDGNENIIYDFTAPYKVSNDTNVVTLSAKAKDGNARVYFNDEYSSNGQFNINNLEPGQTSVLIRVESEDGQTIKTYVVNLAKDYQPDLLLTILLITSLLLWIITILILIIRKNRKKKVDDNQLIF